MTLSAKITAVLLNEGKHSLLANMNNGNLAELLKHSYYQSLKLHNKNQSVFIIYSNFGISNNKRATETIPTGLGKVIGKELGLDKDFASYHDSSWNPTSFNKAKLDNVTELVSNSTHFIHITHNRDIVFKYKGN